MKYAEILIPILKEFYINLKAFSLINFKGWIKIINKFRFFIIKIVLSLSLIQLGFFILCFLIIVLGFRPGLSYNMDLLGLEIYYIGSKLKIIFVIPGMLGILFLIMEFSRRKIIFLVLSSLIVLIYLIGLLLPNPIHTSIASVDITFSFWFYLNGIVLMILVGVGYFALQKPGLIAKNDITDFLLATADQKKV